MCVNGREIIKRAKGKYKFGARMLEKVIEQDCGVHIPHNRIHQHSLSQEKSWSRGGDACRSNGRKVRGYSTDECLS
ncbi:hypothetical protein C5S39_05050 [Candidatus Methanophagaceae archaeon]|nr:hypothetical protein C5S39_05050 [Methanophagales archaeon]